MAENSPKFGVFHRHLADKMLERYGPGVIRVAHIREWVKRAYHIPSIKLSQFFKEMEELGLIKVVDKQNIELG